MKISRDCVTKNSCIADMFGISISDLNISKIGFIRVLDHQCWVSETQFSEQFEEVFNCEGYYLRCNLIYLTSFFFHMFKFHQFDKKKTVRYERDGRLEQLGKRIEGNSEIFGPVAMEVNMSATPRTLRFFQDDEEQPISVINIPSSIRFYIYFGLKGQSFTVTKFEYLQSPTAKGEIKEARVLEWGKNWKKNEDEEDESEEESEDEVPSQVQIQYTPILPNPDCVKVKGNHFTAIERNDSTILFDPVIKKGITRFEVLNLLEQLTSL
ncbi:MAG: hypothetical protein EZS28_036090 [Streblomastix strix]|uniref:Uncharacterized protein n=1 Tax=Streblomastix strix TaxID=222440 RepID=A0A5J4UE55_9EUKA|nr:MAG: hypothetical protein EZS28_036090 [Streblomastix strix]